MISQPQKQVKIPRMRTIKGAYEQIKQDEPNTQVSQYFIRQLVLKGKIKHCMSGGKYLLNYDSLLEYLINPPMDVEEPITHGKIRPIVSK